MKTSFLFPIALLISYCLTAQQVIFPFNDVWKYLDNGSNQGTAWRQTSFNDATWQTGTGKLGYGTATINTVVSFGPSNSKKYITTYFRKTVSIPNPSAYTHFAALVKRDDGLIVYVNGVEVYRNNMPAGNVTYDSLASLSASDDGDDIQMFNINSGAFVSGTNVIAAEVHQQKTNSSDLAFDMRLITPDVQPPSLLSLNRHLPAGVYSAGETLTYRLVFSEEVTGVSRSDFKLTTTGGVTGVLATNAVVQADEAGTIYDVTVSSITGVGTLRMDLRSSATGIADLVGNAIPNVGFTGPVYTIDRIKPVVVSINRNDPLTMNATVPSLTWQIIFSEAVTGLDADDFALAVSSGNLTASLAESTISPIGTDGTTYNITVPGITGEGQIRLDLNAETNIVDIAGNLVIGYNSGQPFYVDRILPVAISISRQLPSEELNAASSLTYRIVFSEPVTGVDAADFLLTTSASATGAIAADAVSMFGTDGTVYDLIVNAVSGAGTIRVDLQESGTGIADALGNAVDGGFIAGQTYNVDHVAPTVTGIVRQLPTGLSTNAETVVFRVVFDEPVFNVDATDFSLFNTGNCTGLLAADAVTAVGSSGMIYDVQVTNISGAGEMRLDPGTATDITDVTANFFSAGFSAGEIFTLDRIVPFVQSISRQQPAEETTSGISVIYRIIFSEPVTQVDLSDFVLTTLSGTAYGELMSITSIDEEETTYDIQVNGLSGAGGLRLDLKTDNSINDFFGNASTGGFIAGESYLVLDETMPIVVSIDRQSPVDELTNLNQIVYRIIFSESVTAVDPTDFLLSTTGSVAGTIAENALTAVGTDGTTYDLIVNSLTGAGSLRLDLKNTGTGITDALNNNIQEGFTGGQSYTIDQIAPTVISILRQLPTEESTSSPELTWRITFSETVNGVDPNDFVLTTVSGNVAASLTPASIQAVGTEGNMYDITVTGHSGNGILRLDVAGTPAISDGAGNAITETYSGSEGYTIIDLTAPSVLSIVRSVPETPATSAATATWRIQFSEPVSGVDVADFTLTIVNGSCTGMLATGAVNMVGTDGATYDITVSNLNGMGSVRVDLNGEGCAITDQENNVLQNGFAAGQSFYVDRISPEVVSVNRQVPLVAITSGTTVTWRLTFSEPVASVDVADFILQTSGGVSGTIQSVAEVPGISGQYDIVISNITGSGNLLLDLNETTLDITDELGNLITTEFSEGENYTLDQLPTVVSINRQSPVELLSASPSLVYRIVFSEPVSGVDAGDFSITVLNGTVSGELNPAGVQVVGTDGTTYDIEITSISGHGTLRLDLNSETSILDAGGNTIAESFSGGEVYEVDRQSPTILEIIRQAPAEESTTAPSLTWRITFDEIIEGLDKTDFELFATGSATGNVDDIIVYPNGVSGYTYYVTLNGIAGEGTLRLDMKNSGTSIADMVGNLMNEGFTSGEQYIIDRIVPSVVSINRYLPLSNGTTATAVTYRVTFTEAVTGVDEADFSLTLTGSVTAALAADAVSAVGTSGMIYDVTVSSITGTGTLRLGLKISNTYILDLAGNPVNGGYASGQLYTIDQSPIVISINREVPLSSNTSEGAVTFRVTFSKKVTGVDITDFIVQPDSGNVRGTLVLLSHEPVGTIATDALKAVGADGTTYDVTVRAIGGSGKLKLSLLPTGTGIKDATGNAISGGFNTGETYNVLQPATEGFTQVVDIDTMAISSHTGEKPQAKLWKYAGKWWSVLATSTGTKIFRLDGQQWVVGMETGLSYITSHGSTKNDCIVVGNVTHILTFRTGSNDSYIISVEYNPATGKYRLWTPRKTKIPLFLGSDSETATMTIDGNGRMWVANDVITDIVVRWSDYPYSVWSAPITIASGITSDDICAIVAMPGKIGVLWSNQTTKSFGFRTHTNGAAPATWSVIESPASQSAQNMGFGFADDHLNLICGSDGTVYCSVKTGYDTPGFEKLILIVRRPSGTWDSAYPVTSNEGTRPIVLLNEAAGKIRVVYSTHENGGDVLYRETPLSSIAFGRPFTLFGGDPDLVYNYATSTHQLHNPDVVILATDLRVGVDYAVTVIASDNSLPLGLSRPDIIPVAEAGLDKTLSPDEKKRSLLAYPNPFVANTRIDYTLPDGGQYSLVLYNSVGVRIAVLKESKAEAGKQDTYYLYGASLKVGIYYIKLETARSMKTIKIIRKE